ncbi:MAG: DUF2975 domain-containing protein [Pseudomonadota bacterium]
MFYINFCKQILALEQRMTDQNPIVEKILRTASIGMWASTIAAGIWLFIIFYYLYFAQTDPDWLAAEVRNSLEGDNLPETWSRSKATLFSIPMLATTILEVITLLNIRRMFIGVRRKGVFTIETASTLKRIGWLVIALAPVGIFAAVWTNAIAHFTTDPIHISVKLGVNNSDLQAIVIGLVVLSVGHMMMSAVEMKQENAAFV